MVKVFDAHCHFGKFGIVRMKGNDIELFRNRELATPEDMERYMKKNNIIKVVAVPHYTPTPEKPFKEFNPAILDALDKVNGFYGGLWVNPAMPDFTKEVLKLFNHPKLVALKISPANWTKDITIDPKTWPAKFKESMESVIEFAKQEKIVLHAHTGHGASSIYAYEKFIEQYGNDLKIQLLHMGSSCSGHAAFVPRFIKLIEKGYDVYTDISSSKGMGLPFLLQELMDKCEEGIERIFFATDEPWGVFGAQFALVNSMDISGRIKSKILFDNANRLYG